MPSTGPTLLTLTWKVDSRSTSAGMRGDVVFARVQRVVIGPKTAYRVHLTFPLPRGIHARDGVLFADVETAQALAEDTFQKWLAAVNLVPEEWIVKPRNAKKNTA